MRELSKYYESQEDRHQEYDDEVYTLIERIEYEHFINNVIKGE